MEKIGLFFASLTGNTEVVVDKISEAFEGHELEIFNIDSASEDDINSFNNLILGSSTTGDGDLLDDWESFLDEHTLNLSEKTVALFGLGNQDYGETFASGVGVLYERLQDSGAKFIGQWPVSDDYDFEDSAALLDEETFVGLILDEDNQDDLTDERIAKWVSTLIDKFQ